MGKNDTPWYPEVNYKNYAYATSLHSEDNEKAKRAYKNAMDLLASAHNSLGNKEIERKGLSNLNVLWQKERTNEQAFIDKYLKVKLDYGDKNKVQKLLQDINIILNSEPLLRSTLASIERIANGKGIDSQIHALTAYTIPEKIRSVILNSFDENFDPNMEWNELITKIYPKLKEEVGKIIDEALDKQEQSGVNPYEDLSLYLDRMQQRENFITQILSGYGIDQAYLKELSKKKKNRGKTAKELASSFGFSTTQRAGSAAEIFISWFGKIALEKIHGSNQFTAQIDTANLNMQKADLIQLIGGIDFDTAEMERIYLEAVQGISKNDESKRLQNMEAIRKMLESLGEAKASIVEISDKSYNLSGKFFTEQHGFSAETPDINSLSKTLSKGQISGDQLSNLVFLLVNSGEDMINKRNVDDAMRVIALNIADFLFDDVTITDALDTYSSNLNVLHIFNLNGILVPLSVFLEGVAHSIENNWEEILNYVSVSFHAKRISYNTDGNKELTEQDWINFYQAKLSNNTVSIHFFGDFVNFIMENLSI